MQLDYVPLLPIIRELYAIPRGQAPDFNRFARFHQYLRTFISADGKTLDIPPLVAINPMAKEGVAARVDELIAIDADETASLAAAEACANLADAPGDYKATLIILDDWLGTWGNRATQEYEVRFLSGPPPAQLPRWTKYFWVTGIVWSSEPVSKRAVREAMLTATYRLEYAQQHGAAQTLRQMLAQEGHVMARAGCNCPFLDPEGIEYTRHVLAPHLDESGLRVAVECLFGDEAAKALGFTPRGVSSSDGLALALHDTVLGNKDPREA